MARGGRGDSDVDDTYVQLLPALISSERAYNAPKAQEACQPGGVPYETFRAYHAAAAKILTDANLRRELVTSVMTANTASSASMMAQHSVALLLRGAPPCDEGSEEEEEPREVLSVVAYHWQSTVATAQITLAATPEALRGRRYFKRLLRDVFAHLSKFGVKRVMLFSLPDVTIRAVYEKLHFTLSSAYVPHWFVVSQSHGGSAPFYERPICDLEAAAAAAGYQAATGGGVVAAAAAAPRGGLSRSLAELARSRSGRRGGRHAARASRPTQHAGRDVAAAGTGRGPDYRDADGRDEDEEAGVPHYWPESNIIFTSQTLGRIEWASKVPPRRSPAVAIQKISPGRRVVGGGPHPCVGRYGLFAQRALRTDDFVSTYGGLLRDKDRPGRDDEEDSGYVMGLGNLDLDAALCGSEGRYANDYHGIAASPNTTYVWRNLAATGQGWVELRATRSIAPGDELVVNYGEQWWDARNEQMRRARLLDGAASGAVPASLGAGEPPSPVAVRARKWGGSSQPLAQGGAGGSTGGASITPVPSAATSEAEEDVEEAVEGGAGGAGDSDADEEDAFASPPPSQQQQQHRGAPGGVARSGGGALQPVRKSRRVQHAAAALKPPVVEEPVVIDLLDDSDVEDAVPPPEAAAAPGGAKAPVIDVGPVESGGTGASPAALSIPRKRSRSRSRSREAAPSASPAARAPKTQPPSPAAPPPAVAPPPSVAPPAVVPPSPLAGTGDTVDDGIEVD